MGRTLDPSEVTTCGEAREWYEHDYQWSQGQLVILRKDSWSSCARTTATATPCSSTSGARPGRSALTSIIRGRAKHSFSDTTSDSYGELALLFENPRRHTDKGYHRRDESVHESSPPRRQRDVACPGCGKTYFTMGDSAQHFESGSCPSCPGAANARKTMYTLLRQRESVANADGMFINGQRLLTFDGDG
jgi:hypothetical protein